MDIQVLQMRAGIFRHEQSSLEVPLPVVEARLLIWLKSRRPFSKRCVHTNRCVELAIFLVNVCEELKSTYLLSIERSRQPAVNTTATSSKI